MFSPIICIYLLLWTVPISASTGSGDTAAVVHHVNATVGSAVSLSCLPFLDGSVSAQMMDGSDCQVTGRFQPGLQGDHLHLQVNLDQMEKLQNGIDNLGLRITNVQNQDEGIYYMNITCPTHSLDSSCFLQLHVMEFEFDEMLPAQLLFEMGTSRTVHCGAHLDNATHATSWSRPISGVLQMDGDLQLNNISMEDAGLYTCSASYDLHTITMKTNISVFKHLEFTHQSPSKKTVHEMNETILSCSVHGWPIPTIEWSRDNVSLPADLDSSHIWGLMHSSFLTIHRASHKDDGWYTCTATNTMESRKQSTFLHVVGVPGNPSVHAHSGWDHVSFPARLYATLHWNVTQDGGAPVQSISLVILGAHDDPYDKSKWPTPTTYPSQQHIIEIHQLMPATEYKVILWASNKYGPGHVTIVDIKTASSSEEELIANKRERNLIVKILGGGSAIIVFLVITVLGIIKFRARRNNRIEYLLQSRTRTDSEESDVKIVDAKLVWQFKNPMYNKAENVNDIGACNVLSAPPVTTDANITASSPRSSGQRDNFMRFCPESPINNNAY